MTNERISSGDLAVTRNENGVAEITPLQNFCVCTTDGQRVQGDIVATNGPIDLSNSLDGFLIYTSRGSWYIGCYYRDSIGPFTEASPSVHDSALSAREVHISSDSTGYAYAYVPYDGGSTLVTRVFRTVFGRDPKHVYYHAATRRIYAYQNYFSGHTPQARVVCLEMRCVDHDSVGNQLFAKGRSWKAQIACDTSYHVHKVDLTAQVDVDQWFDLDDSLTVFTATVAEPTMVVGSYDSEIRVESIWPVDPTPVQLALPDKSWRSAIHDSHVWTLSRRVNQEANMRNDEPVEGEVSDQMYGVDFLALSDEQVGLGVYYSDVAMAESVGEDYILSSTLQDGLDAIDGYVQSLRDTLMVEDKDAYVYADKYLTKVRDSARTNLVNGCQVGAFANDFPCLNMNWFDEAVDRADRSVHYDERDTYGAPSKLAQYVASLSTSLASSSVDSEIWHTNTGPHVMRTPVTVHYVYAPDLEPFHGYRSYITDACVYVVSNPVPNVYQLSIHCRCFAENDGALKTELQRCFAEVAGMYSQYSTDTASWIVPDGYFTADKYSEVKTFARAGLQTAIYGAATGAIITAGTGPGALIGAAVGGVIGFVAGGLVSVSDTATNVNIKYSILSRMNGSLSQYWYANSGAALSAIGYYIVRGLVPSQPSVTTVTFPNFDAYVTVGSSDSVKAMLVHAAAINCVVLTGAAKSYYSKTRVKTNDQTVQTVRTNRRTNGVESWYESEVTTNTSWLVGAVRAKQFSPGNILSAEVAAMMTAAGVVPAMVDWTVEKVSGYTTDSTSAAISELNNRVKELQDRIDELVGFISDLTIRDKRTYYM